MADIDEIARELSVLIPRMMRGIQTSLAPVASITLPQFVLLVGLKDTGPTAVSEIARARNVSPPTVTRLVDRLIDAHMVTRVEDSHDRRRVLVQLTPQGETAVRRFQEAIGERWKTVLVHLPEQEQEAFLNAIRRVGGVLAEVEKTSHPVAEGIL